MQHAKNILIKIHKLNILTYAIKIGNKHPLLMNKDIEIFCKTMYKYFDWKHNFH